MKRKITTALLAVICIGLLVTGCEHQQTRAEWLTNLRVGDQWTEPPDGGWNVAESSTDWNKYRVRDPRIGAPIACFVTVKSNIVVAIWEQ